MRRPICVVPGCDREFTAKGMCLKHYKAARRPRPLTSAERFWMRYVITPTGCWEWQSPRRADGYGQVTIDGQKWLAHRYSYTIKVYRRLGQRHLHGLGSTQHHGSGPMTPTWTCLNPTCTEGGHLDEIKPNSGPDVQHHRATGHGTTAWASDDTATVTSRGAAGGER